MGSFVASTSMNQHERDVHTPNFKTVSALNAVLNVPTAFLFCVEDDLAEAILKFGENRQ